MGRDDRLNDLVLCSSDEVEECLTVYWRSVVVENQRGGGARDSQLVWVYGINRWGFCEIEGRRSLKAQPGLCDRSRKLWTYGSSGLHRLFLACACSNEVFTRAFVSGVEGLREGRVNVDPISVGTIAKDKIIDISIIFI